MGRGGGAMGNGPAHSAFEKPAIDVEEASQNYFSSHRPTPLHSARRQRQAAAAAAAVALESQQEAEETSDIADKETLINGILNGATKSEPDFPVPLIPLVSRRKQVERSRKRRPSPQTIAFMQPQGTQPGDQLRQSALFPPPYCQDSL